MLLESLKHLEFLPVIKRQYLEKLRCKLSKLRLLELDLPGPLPI